MYRLQARDTSLEMERFLICALRDLPAHQKAKRVQGLTVGLQRLCYAGICQQYPDIEKLERRQHYALRWLGGNWAIKVVPLGTGWMVGDPITFALEIADILDRLKIPYLVGGSLASSILGEPRATMDLDVVADLQGQQAAALIEAFQSSYYISESAIYAALGAQADFPSFNAIELETLQKLDVFVLGEQPFTRAAMERRQRVAVRENPPGYLWIYTAEDIILQKLLWYRLGEQTSSQQWRDVLGVLKIQAEKLDRLHLDSWSQSLGLSEMLARAIQEAGLADTQEGQL